MRVNLKKFLQCPLDEEHKLRGMYQNLFFKTEALIREKQKQEPARTIFG
jgi:hypothetical protein